MLNLWPEDPLTGRTPDHAVTCRASLMQVARQDIRQLTDIRSRATSSSPRRHRRQWRSPEKYRPALAEGSGDTKKRRAR
jgi:hypothetical protein